MANWYVSSVAYAAVAQWSAATAVSLGAIRRQLAAPSAGNERCFRCTTAGTTGGAEPSWNLGLNATTNDNGVVWTECTGQEAYQAAGNWTAPAANLQVIIGSSGRAPSTWTAAPDNVFIASDHTETWSTNLTWNQINQVTCVTVAGSSLPPAAASIATGAAVNTTGTGSITLGRSGAFYGVNFTIGNGGSSANLTVGGVSTSGTVVIEAGTITYGSTNSGTRIYIGSTNASVVSSISSLVLINSVLAFGHASQGIAFNTVGSTFEWYNTPSNALQGTIPNNLITYTYNRDNPNVVIRNVDLSALTGNILQTSGGSNALLGNVVVTGCKLNATTQLAGNLRVMSPAMNLVMTNSDNASANSIARAAYGAVGSSTAGIQASTSIYRDGGATAGSGVPYSWYVTGSATGTGGSPTYQGHPITPPIRLWNTALGVAKTITINGIANKAALPTNLICFLEVQYLASSGATQVTSLSGGPGPIYPAVGTNVTANSETWGTGAAARANSTAYSVGDAIRVSSNAGRLFFCTTAGTSSGSLPAGYASAVDGGSVNDGTAVFRAGWRFSMSLTVTPQKEGWLTALCHYLDAQATPTNIYFDPKMIVT